MYATGKHVALECGRWDAALVPLLGPAVAGVALIGGGGVWTQIGLQVRRNALW